MGKNIPWNIIGKCFGEQAAREESDRLDNWLEEDKENKKILAEIYNVYSLSGTLPQTIHPDKEKAWEKIDRLTSNKITPLIRFIKNFRYAAAAAAILIASIIVFLLINTRHPKVLQQYTEIVSPLGQKSLIILPDSSLVWLNSGSSLKHKGSFNVKEREVILEGEAFFNVKEDKSKLFRVKTGILNVDVYGTSFNIKNYENDSLQEITVSEGEVGISGGLKKSKKITKGEQALLNKNSNKISFVNTDPEIVSSWKNNELIFDNDPLTEVIKYLERWYGVNITIDKEMLGKHNYTFKIKTESFIEMLEKMKIMTPLVYEINGKDVKIKYTN